MLNFGIPSINSGYSNYQSVVVGQDHSDDKGKAAKMHFNYHNLCSAHCVRNFKKINPQVSLRSYEFDMHIFVLSYMHGCKVQYLVLLYCTYFRKLCKTRIFEIFTKFHFLLISY